MSVESSAPEEPEVGCASLLVSRNQWRRRVYLIAGRTSLACDRLSSVHGSSFGFQGKAKKLGWRGRCKKSGCCYVLKDFINVLTARMYSNMDASAVSPGRPSRSFSVCNLVLSVLFAYSALVQLNDNDWYIWLTLYTLACLVCLAHAFQFSTASRLSAFVALVGGSLLFIKVVLEGCLRDEGFSWTGFVSIDMDQRLVREKLGSFIVSLSMWLELEVSNGAIGKGGWSPASLHAGMLLLTSASIGLCAAYFAGDRRRNL